MNYYTSTVHVVGSSAHRPGPQTNNHEREKKVVRSVNLTSHLVIPAKVDRTHASKRVQRSMSKQPEEEAERNAGGEEQKQKLI